METNPGKGEILNETLDPSEWSNGAWIKRKEVSKSGFSKPVDRWKPALRIQRRGFLKIQRVKCRLMSSWWLKNTFKSGSAICSSKRKTSKWWVGEGEGKEEKKRERSCQFPEEFTLRLSAPQNWTNQPHSGNLSNLGIVINKFPVSPARTIARRKSPFFHIEPALLRMSRDPLNRNDPPFLRPPTPGRTNLDQKCGKMGFLKIALGACLLLTKIIDFG